MGIVSMFRKAAGTTIGLIGVILWFVGGLLCLVWTLYVLFSLFGIWTIFVGLLLAPVTYVASILIVWFSTGQFPWLFLVPYITSFIGIGLAAVGEKIKGEEIEAQIGEVQPSLSERAEIEKERKRQSNTFGIWSLVPGIIGIFWWPAVCGIIAVVLGVVQFRRRITKCSVAGFTLGVVDIVLGLLYYLLGLSPFVF